MTKQPTSLFDPDARFFAEPSVERAAFRRDEGMARAEDHATVEWKDEAAEFLRRYLEEHETMHVDELWAAGMPVPESLRALGPLFNRATRAGLMVKTGRYRPSIRSNLTEKPIWRSLIWKGM